MDIQKLKKPEGGHLKPMSPEVQLPEKGVEKERALDTVSKQKEVKIEQKVESAPIVATTKKTPATTLATEKDELTLQIEKVLEEDIEDIYFNMPPDAQKQFRKKGEETANKIKKLLGEIKIKTKEIIKLIVEWLRVIPNVNKFFIEQEAKIKAEKIFNIKSPK